MYPGVYNEGSPMYGGYSDIMVADEHFVTCFAENICNHDIRVPFIRGGSVMHPFGQPAITTSHSNWDYYAKIIQRFGKVCNGGSGD
ncbi:hypothetical protein RJ639_046216 [Escallonia herrerae]|uniref:Uncharacterized protein n=1 Tax=Escallonia herrerae TaxID=1293975 RepID=A0AA88W5Y5_9ASTE|nr:hypothetical protein RJ639_046216 [Escallonia herrerae]